MGDEVYYDNINGVPLQYIRNGYYQSTTVASTYAFRDKLEDWQSDLQNAAGNRANYGSMTRIVTAGAYVNKPGAHGQGRAFDIDMVRWVNGSSRPYEQYHSSSNRTLRRRYLGLNALCQRHFKWVLNGWYDAAHEDHIHVDDVGGALLLNKSSKSDVTFIQAMCNDVMGSNLVIDGVYGPNTDTEYRKSKDRVDITGDTSSDQGAWRLWCWRTGVPAFRDDSI